MSCVNIKKLNSEAKIPYRATSGAAGYDLYSCIDKEEIIILPGEIKKIPTGLAISMPKNYYAEIRPRSGLSLKGIIAINGTVDSDYRGEVSVVLHNVSTESFNILNNMRIAQMVFKIYETPNLCVVDELDETERGPNGYSSTGFH